MKRLGRTLEAKYGLLAWLCLIGFVSNARCERLPIKTYTTTDGLAHERVRRIVRDSRSFLWFCTIDGLSKFDGYRFTTYRREEGLPASSVNDLLETSQGMYWIATDGGLSRFNPASENATSHFQTYQVGAEVGDNRIQALYEDHAGRIWLGTENGLFRLQEINGKASFQKIELGNVNREQTTWSITEGEGGELWLGTAGGLIRFSPDGKSVHYAFQAKESSSSVRALLRDRDGLIWFGLNTDLFVFKPAPDTSGVNHVQVSTDAIGITHRGGGTAGHEALLSLPSAGRAVHFTVGDGLDKAVRSLYQTADGHIWISTEGAGAIEIDGVQLHRYGEAQGLRGNAINTFAEDVDGNLWLGSDTGGALKLTRNGFVGFFTHDGLGHSWIGSIFEQGSDNFYVLSGEDFINQFDGQRFEHVRIAARTSLSGRFAAALRDHLGEWWIATPSGLWRFTNVKHISQLPSAHPLIYTGRDGIGVGEVVRIFEDSRGDLWVFTRASGEFSLSRWQRANEKWRHYTDVDGVPSFNGISGFVEDRAGDLWIGFGGRGVARFRNERFEFVEGHDNASFEQPKALHVDANGRLWVLLSQGALYACDDPIAEQSSFFPQPAAPELQLANATCMTSDLEGRLYFGTPRGVERLNVKTGRVNHYTTAEGLCNNEVSRAFRDRHGALWFATLDGLARFLPEPERKRPPPPVFIGALHIAGVPYNLSELGTTALMNLSLAATQTQVQIDFFAPDFSAGEPLRYQYMLEGADTAWSAPSERRTVNYENLAPGAYRFIVRAVNADGVSSPQPAFVSFHIAPPMWRSWWFLSLALFLLAGAGYALYNYRVCQLLEVERVRTRIAIDLHDDIGASLSRMAILSEVVKRQDEIKSGTSKRILTEIADSARGLVDTMGDIVWSIDPHKDDLQSVTTRIRQFASDVLEARGIKWDLKLPHELETVKLSADQRRQVLLIFKEALNNIVRHADCANVTLSLALDRHALAAEVRDDGCGFDLERADPSSGNGRPGNGLKNMRARVLQLGGAFDVSSSLGKGTRLTFRVPLK